MKKEKKQEIETPLFAVFATIGIVVVIIVLMLLILSLPSIAQDIWWDMKDIPYSTAEFEKLGCIALIPSNEIEAQSGFYIINHKIYSKTKYSINHSRTLFNASSNGEITWYCLREKENLK